MVNEEKLIDITQFLFRELYLSINTLKEKYNCKDDEIYTILGEIEQRSKQLGLKLEIVELKGNDHVFFSIPSNNTTITPVEISLLLIFAIISRKRGGEIVKEELESIFENKLDYLELLVNKNYLIKKPNYWQISPVGASLVIPLLPKTQQLIIEQFEDEKQVE
ncbi:MAG: hypothetical protein ACXAC7_02355 [Candidatus Hodarchaeales archaeon]|jgi:hypothetical protein